ncbi:MAG: OB-fold putative lipoprotein [Bacteroidales bacterium]|nr:OB-fold putative lipoprotein [Bacteroidales bacterium]
MKRKKIIKMAAILVIAGVIIGGGIGLYLFNMPKRDIQNTKTDFSLTSSALVAEYLTDQEAANQKYLAADGESKILEVAGTVSKISENFNGQKVVLLKDKSDKAGVSATFTEESAGQISAIQVGQNIRIKGVIRSGAAYDQDLGLYEHVILEKTAIVND